MGHYTNFRFKAKLRIDTPKEVLTLLDNTINKGITDKVIFTSEDIPRPAIEHPFFDCRRWYMLFLSTNFDKSLQGGRFYLKNNRCVLDIHTEFKNYDDEIDQFMDWIKPYVSGRKKKQYVGYEKPEWSDTESNLYIER